MTRERRIGELIDRLLSGELLSKEMLSEADFGATAPAGLARLHRVFEAFAQVRKETPTTTPALHAAGERVGAFALLERLGSGGMGEVWLAERCDGLAEQRVAIKFVNAARASFVERLEREQRLLARLAHPYIARFLDAGRDACGMPYLVMDHVEGEPIDAWCDARRLGWAARVDLVLRVCAAVEHAHRQLVVHRDLKPANILVCADGTPRLLDFGIAALLEQAGGERMQSELPALTLAWAAPEQFDGSPVSTATDVHALGLLLLRLLAGQLPPARRSGSLLDMTRDAAAGGDIRASRLLASETPPHWPIAPARLAGDGDAIIAKALRREPRLRYGSVAEFADDLRRWRDARPVRARPPTRAYRLRRFVARHRLGVAAAVLALAALLTGFGVALWQAGVARGEAARADRAAQRAARVAAFMTGVIREQDPLERDAADARSARELVAEGVARARAELADEPALRSSMLGVLGEATMNLGDLDAARALIAEARAGLPADSTEAARLDAQLGNIAIRQGHESEGLALLDAALPTLRAGMPDDRVAAARLGVRRAFARFGKGAADEGLAMLQADFELLRELLGPDHPDTLDAESAMLSMLSQMRRDDEAAALARDVVARLERSVGSDSMRLVDPLNYWAQIERRRGHYAESIARFERAIAIARRHLGERSESLASLLSRLANAQRDAGQLDAALATLERAERTLPADVPIERAQMLANRGETLFDLGRPAEAEVALRESLRLRRAALGDGDGMVWYAQSQWARALNALGRREQARRVQSEALTRLEAIMGKDAYQLTFVLRALAETCADSGDFAAAAAALQRTLALAGGKYPPDHLVVVEYRARLADALHRAGDADGALREADGVLAAREAHPELAIHAARAAQVKAAVLDKRGERDAARELARQGLADLERTASRDAALRRALLAAAR